MIIIYHRDWAHSLIPIATPTKMAHIREFIFSIEDKQQIK